MASSSFTQHSNTDNQQDEVNEVLLKFHNKICDCGMEAIKRISESTNNPHKSYDCCPKNKDVFILLSFAMIIPDFLIFNEFFRHY